ncbi:transglycosylase SLT domain-containing protein [[Mannheimia] succiniciproducens]|uniref:MltE protein n=1 Tax=Mannheimia succiniciproducens (strain KCTC 0769BP / MBEL55E) TaxID=221988 RepID=Q65S88_MANSM|nr:transglycosylase SLT domain-containing protein [[Mannheimia] succiniciproducens]AAU38172.1 MltE protein [[Mannheimia] succiniciproducens MBEL55E]
MNFSRFALALFSFGAVMPVIAAEQSLSQQREIYQKINQLLSISQSENTQNIAKALLDEMKDYPLYPYAEYKLISSNLANTDFAQIEAYLQRRKDFPLAKNLTKQWVIQHQNNQDWQGILANQDKLPKDIVSQCALLQAKSPISPVIDTNNQNALKSAVNSAQILTEKAEHPLPQAELEKLWLTGNSLPKACDPILDQWNQTGGLTADLIRRRAVLALEQGNSGLLTHLSAQTQDTGLQNWLKTLAAIQKTPQKLKDPANPFNPDKLEPNTQNKRIAKALFPSFVRTIKDNEVGDPQRLLAQFDGWAKRFNLTAEETTDWEIAVISQLFDSPNTLLQQWRDTELKNLKADKLTERRIRMAIRNKEDIKPWLTLLSDKAKNADEWKYWTAKTLQRSTDKAEQNQANALLSSLLNQRGFYPMLATQELGRAYQINLRNEENLAKPTASSKPENPAPAKPSAQELTAQKYAAELSRIEELRILADTNNMNTEWRSLFARANFDEQIALTEYARDKQWFDLQVEGTILAKAWNHISLRLPNAYPQWFDLLLKNKKIDRTFAMAIARQESAWKPYVTSSADARGLMQLLPSTAKLTAQKAGLPYSNANQLYDPFNNIMLGTAHLQELQDKYGNNRILISAAYNAGGSRVDQWLAKSAGKLTMAEFVASIPFYETRGYVQNVLAYDAYYQLLQNKKAQIFANEEYNRLY